MFEHAAGDIRGGTYAHTPLKPSTDSAQGVVILVERSLKRVNCLRRLLWQLLTWICKVLGKSAEVIARCACTPFRHLYPEPVRWLLKKRPG